MKRKIYALGIFMIIALALVVSACSSNSAEQAKSESNTVVSWDKAKDYVGHTITVHGPVVSTSYADTADKQPTFLNIGKPYPDPERFTVVIWGKNRDKFSNVVGNPPELYYDGKSIDVEGKVIKQQGIVEIEASEISQINVSNP